MQDQALPHLGDLTATEFLRDYWQKKPLLVRNAFPDIAALVNPEELMDLACEEGVEARIVVEKGEKPWQLHYGPFDDKAFRKMPHTHWTLLVQAVDQYLPALADYLDCFAFVPNWRIDDIMISYAPQGGSVGPHYDQYDVFLIQGLGQRRWQLGQQCDENSPRVAGTPLRILQNIDVHFDEVLNPGDLLYVPPGLAHNGVAQNDCMTYSVGFRAPALAHVLERLVDGTLEKQGARQLYTDADLALSSSPGHLNAAALENLRRQVIALVDDPQRFQEAIAPFLSEPKYDDYEPETMEVEPRELLEALAAGGELVRDPASRCLYTGEPGQPGLLFINGQEQGFPASLGPLVCQLTDQRRLTAQELSKWLQQPVALAWLTEQVAAGHWLVEMPDEE